MGISTTNSRENQTRKLQIKTLDQQMKRVAVDGTGIAFIRGQYWTVFKCLANHDGYQGSPDPNVVH